MIRHFYSTVSRNNGKYERLQINDFMIRSNNNSRPHHFVIEKMAASIQENVTPVRCQDIGEFQVKHGF